MINRRKFLILGSGVIAMATTPNLLAKSTSMITTSQHLKAASVKQQFHDKIGDSFFVRSKEDSGWLTLAKVETRAEEHNLEQFSLIFTSAQGNLHSNLYSATHIASLQTQKIRLEPSQKPQHYVATFSLLRNTG